MTNIWGPNEVAFVLKLRGEGKKAKEVAAALSKQTGLPVSEPAIRGIWGRAKDAPVVATADQHLALFKAKKEATKTKGAFKSMVEELEASRERQAFLDEGAKFKAPPRILPTAKSSKRELTAVVLASDWHVEEQVDPASIAYRNEYNLEIADRRVKKFFEAIAWNIHHQRASKQLSIDNLVLWLGGDLMTGYIHEELMEGNALSPSETMLWLLPRLRNGIHTLAETLNLKSIVVPCSYGNHGRTTLKPRVATGYANSFEWLMYNQLQALFEGNPKVKFHITPSAHQYVEVYDKVIHFHHGDDVMYNGGVGGLGVPLLKAVPMWDSVKHSDYHCLGHHHTLLDYGHVVVNGSLIGYGPYSQRIRAKFEPPQQGMFYVDKKRGKCMTTALWVD